MRFKFPVYCTPDDVAEVMDLPDPNGDNYGMFSFSDLSHPSYKSVEKMIISNEDKMDRLMKRSWREHRVEEDVTSIHNYWQDGNGVRIGYRENGGDYIQLRRDVLPWDPAKGDKLEVRTRNNHWVNVTYKEQDTPNGANAIETTYGTQEDRLIYGPAISFWIDHSKGRLFIRHGAYQPMGNAIRLAYRYGHEVPVVKDEEGNVLGTDFESEDYTVPQAISRMCALMTAKQVINMQVFNIKVGAGGDLGDVRKELLTNWQSEIDEIFLSYRRVGSVHSLYR